MEIAYFVLLLALGGCFVWLLCRQHRQALELLAGAQEQCNRAHEHYQHQISNERSLANAEITRMAEVIRDIQAVHDTRNQLFKQFAEQVKLEMVHALGRAACDTMKKYHEVSTKERG